MVVVLVDVDVDVEVEVVVKAAVARHLVPSCLHNLKLVVSKNKSPSTPTLGSEDRHLILPAKLKCLVVIYK